MSFEGFGHIPSRLTTLPSSIPEGTPKMHFLGLSFHLYLFSALNVRPKLSIRVLASLIGLAVFVTFKECSIRLHGTLGMSTGFHVKMLMLSLRNLMSASSYLASRLAPMRAVFSRLQSTSWTSVCSLDSVLFLGVSYSGSLSWSGETCVACVTVSTIRIERSIASVILKLSSSQVYAV